MDTPYQVLWFDPGGKTGWIQAYVEGDRITFEHGTLRVPGHHSEVRNKMLEFMMKRDDYGNLTIGSESFTFRKSPSSAGGREGLELISKEYIGVMELVCFDHGLRLEQQSPSILGGGLVTNDHLKALGLLPPPPLQENKDMIAAARHIVHYLINTARGDARKYIIDCYKKANL